MYCLLLAMHISSISQPRSDTFVLSFVNYIFECYPFFLSLLQLISCIHCPSFHFLKIIFRLRKFFLPNFILSSMSKKVKSLLLFLDIFLYLCPKFGWNKNYFWSNTACHKINLRSGAKFSIFFVFFSIFFLFKNVAQLYSFFMCLMLAIVL